MPDKNTGTPIVAGHVSSALIEIRKDGYNAYGEHGPLWEVLGLDSYDEERIKALLTKFIRQSMDHGVNADILLSVFQLLPDYKNKATLDERYDFYLRNNFDAFLWELHRKLYPKYCQYRKDEDNEKIEIMIQRAKGNLRKTDEPNLIRQLAAHIVKIQNSPGFLEVDGFYDKKTRRAIIPTQSDCSESGVTEIPPLPDPDEPPVIPAVKRTFPQTLPEEFILTPNAPRWEGRRILGRDDFVAELCLVLQEGTPHFQLTGMGGIGKTEILNKVYVYFADHPSEHCFDHVGLLSYDGSVDAALTGQFVFSDDSDSETVWETLRKLCDRDHVLLLIDDIRCAKESEASEEFLRRLLPLKAAILLASRVLLDGFEGKPVVPLLAENCVRVFQGQRHIDQNLADIPPLPEEDAALLAKILHDRAGNNSLIAARLGAITRNYGWSVRQLAEKLEESSFHIRKSLDSDEKLQEEINKLYRVEDIRSPAERNILEAFALFPEIPLEQGFSAAMLELDAGIDSSDDFRLLLTELFSHTWLTQHRCDDDGTISYSMHQMVKSAFLARAEPIRLENHRVLLRGLQNLVDWSIAQGDHLKARPFMPFAIAVTEFFRREAPEETLSATIAISRYYSDFFYFGAALEFLQKALPVYEEKLGVHHRATACIYQWIGMMHQGLSNDTQSLEYYRKALAVFENVPEAPRQSITQVYDCAALVCLEQRAYTEALEYLQKALSIYMEEPDSNRLAIAAVYVNISKAYAEQGNASESTQWKQKSLEILKIEAEAEQPSLLAGRAGVLAEQGDFFGALALLQEDLDRCVSKGNPEHPEAADIDIKIANVYEKQGDYPSALEYLHRALKIYEDTFEPESPRTASVYAGIGRVLRTQKDYSGALENYQKALKIYKLEFRTDHPVTILAYYNIASVYILQNDYANGLKWIYKSLDASESRLGPEHPYTRLIRQPIPYLEGKQKGFKAWLMRKLNLQDNPAET